METKFYFNARIIFATILIMFFSNCFAQFGELYSCKYESKKNIFYFYLTLDTANMYYFSMDIYTINESKGLTQPISWGHYFYENNILKLQDSTNEFTLTIRRKNRNLLKIKHSFRFLKGIKLIKEKNIRFVNNKEYSYGSNYLMKPPLNEIILNSFNSHVNIKEGTFSNEEGYTLYLKKNGQYIYYLDHPRVLNKRYILSEGNWIKDTGTIKLMDKTFNYELKISIEDSNNLTSKFPCFNNRILLKNYK